MCEQKKLEGELQQIEEKHRAKKCKFAESSEQFYEQLARVHFTLMYEEEEEDFA